MYSHTRRSPGQRSCVLRWCKHKKAFGLFVGEPGGNCRFMFELNGLVDMGLFKGRLFEHLKS